VETPTGDYYGGNRPGATHFADSPVCLDAKTGKRIWHYQLVHHDNWDWDIPAPPILADITVNGKTIKAVAQVTKHAFTFVFDRATGEPVWPIEERPVPQSDVPGEKTSATQPFPTKPPPFDRQGVTEDDLLDFTPELKAEAVKIASDYLLGSMFQPPILRDSNGKIGALILPATTGGTNWTGGAFDPETGMLYVSSVTDPEGLSVVPADPKRSDIGYFGSRVRGGGGGRGARAGAGASGGRGGSGEGGEGASAAPRTVRAQAQSSIGPQGLPLAKPPWGRITAIDLNKGDHVWMTANGDAPDYVKNHPALKGIDLSNTGRPEKSPLMVTKTLLFAADGPGLFNAGAGAGGPMFRALDKKTGKIIHEMELPSSTTGIPMTYLANDRQFIVVAIGGRGFPAELVALTLP
jgi:quinoprotein glucose dehydrogenase